MQRTMLKSKLHRVTVTGADIDYEGSVAIDETLLETADILPFEKVDIYNITNGARLHTYAIKGERDSGAIIVNGAAARCVQKGDLVIICSYVQVEEGEVRDWCPKVVLVDERNGVRSVIQS